MMYEVVWMLSFFKDLFDSGMFMPHGQCFLWYPEVLWLHVISDIVISLAYFSIPVAILFIIAKQKKSLPFKWIYGMFAAFILLCGLTHLVAIIVLWEPVYRFQGLLKAMTAGVSIATAFLIIPIVPQIIEILSQIHHAEDDNDAKQES